MKKIFLLLLACIFALTACIENPYQQKFDDGMETTEGKEVQETQQEGGPAEKDAPHPISIDAFIAKDFIGSDFTIGTVLADNSAYTRYYVTYKANGVKVSGIMNVPKGAGPWPLLILAHGYIDPAVYTNGRGLKREQDYLARQGYVIIHPDYRNHADSDKDENVEQWFRLKYAEDVIGLVDAVKKAQLDYINTDKIGMLGHSMGGGVALNTMVIRPELIDAFVLFAPVSADYRRNFDKWTKSRTAVAEEILETHGSPEENPEFWDGISAVNYFDRIIAPIMIHHGDEDESVPLAWSDELNNWLVKAGKTATYHVYDGEPHEFINAWPLVMQRTTAWFDQYLK